MYLMQFKLNWKKAQLFASFFGPPDSKLPKVTVLTDWVPPVVHLQRAFLQANPFSFSSPSHDPVFSQCTTVCFLLTHKVKQETVKQREMS